MGGPPSVITGKTQREIGTIRLMEPDVLTKEHAPGKHPLATSKAQETTSVPQRHDFPVRSFPSCRKREPSRVSNRTIAGAIRKCPCDEMLSGHHQKRCGAHPLHLSPGFSPVAILTFGGTMKCWFQRLGSKMRRKDKLSYGYRKAQIDIWSRAET